MKTINIYDDDVFDLFTSFVYNLQVKKGKDVKVTYTYALHELLKKERTLADAK